MVLTGICPRTLCTECSSKQPCSSQSETRTSTYTVGTAPFQAAEFQIDVFMFLPDGERWVLKDLHHAHEKLLHDVAQSTSKAAVQDLHSSPARQQTWHACTRLSSALSVTLLVYHWLYFPPIFWNRAFIQGCFFNLRRLSQDGLHTGIPHCTHCTQLLSSCLAHRPHKFGQAECQSKGSCQSAHQRHPPDKAKTASSIIPASQPSTPFHMPASQ